MTPHANVTINNVFRHCKCPQGQNHPGSRTSVPDDSQFPLVMFSHSACHYGSWMHLSFILKMILLMAEKWPYSPQSQEGKWSHKAQMLSDKFRTSYSRGCLKEQLGTLHGMDLSRCISALEGRIETFLRRDFWWGEKESRRENLSMTSHLPSLLQESLRNKQSYSAFLFLISYAR